MDLEHPEGAFAKEMLAHNHWGKANGRTLIITSSPRMNLFLALNDASDEGRVLTTKEVDVKDLLELGRVVIEKGALDEMLAERQSDLVPKGSAV